MFAFVGAALRRPLARNKKLNIWRAAQRRPYIRYILLCTFLAMIQFDIVICYAYRTIDSMEAGGYNHRAETLRR